MDKWHITNVTIANSTQSASILNYFLAKQPKQLKQQHQKLLEQKSLD